MARIRGFSDVYLGLPPLADLAVCRPASAALLP